MCQPYSTVCRWQQKTLGVILPSALTFNTGVPEVMEGVGGSCRVRLKGADGQPGDWKNYGLGESFNVPGNSSFEITCDEAYHYVCHFG